jgi:hypothetical protein
MESFLISSFQAFFRFSSFVWIIWHCLDYHTNGSNALIAPNKFFIRISSEKWSKKQWNECLIWRNDKKPRDKRKSPLVSFVGFTRLMFLEGGWLETVQMKVKKSLQCLLFQGFSRRFCWCHIHFRSQFFYRRWIIGSLNHWLLCRLLNTVSTEVST